MGWCGVNRLTAFRAPWAHPCQCPGQGDAIDFEHTRDCLLRHARIGEGMGYGCGYRRGLGLAHGLFPRMIWAYRSILPLQSRPVLSMQRYRHIYPFLIMENLITGALFCLALSPFVIAPIVFFIGLWRAVEAGNNAQYAHDKWTRANKERYAQIILGKRP